MRIDRLHIDGFRNLRDFTIDLEEHQFTTVLIGDNGTGKSNLIEAIVLLFRELDLGRPAPFDYEIRYRCRGSDVLIRGVLGKRPSVALIKDDAENSMGWTEFVRRKDELLPKYVFAYYSGPSKRLQSYFYQHQKDFYEVLLNTHTGEAPPIRRLFFCLPEHSRWVLLSYFLHSDTPPPFLRDYFGIEGFDSALLVLKQPPWAKNTPTKEVRELGDDRFWWARGVVKTFLQRLWDEALAPVYIEEEYLGDYRTRAKREERLYLYLPQQSSVQRLTAEYPTEAALFAALESTDIADLVRDVRVRVKRGGDSIVMSEMSEGEQQLLTVIGLMQFTKHEESLFLLDEPDTHLNPNWKLRYLTELVRQAGLVRQADNGEGLDATSQLLLTTHDPLTIAGLEANQVQVFRRFGNKVGVETPAVDPRGLGVAGVLTRMFQLPTTLDLPTQRLVDERNRLVRRPRAELTPEESGRLDELTAALDALGLVYEARDPLYDKFLHALFRWEESRGERIEEASEDAQMRVVDEILAALKEDEP